MFHKHSSFHRPMRLLLLVLCFSPQGCVEKLVTIGATGIGAGTGALIGGPGGAAVGGMLGYGGGEVYGLKKENVDIKELITETAVQQIVDANMAEHRTGIDAFKNTIQKLLMVVGGVLLIYLGIPIFIAKYSAEKCHKQTMTRAPFQTYEKPKTTGTNLS